MRDRLDTQLVARGLAESREKAKRLILAGAVRVDGIDVRDYDTEELWSALGLVPQRGYLFSGTVAENLRFGKADADEDEMWAALRVAAADDFVRAHPDGLEMRVAQGGINFSGGQRQRLAIARALVRNPRLVILDEATSALDTASEKLVQEALVRLAEGRTTLIVAHRFSTIRHAHRVVVLSRGRIAEVGTQAELMARRGLFFRLASLQTVGPG